MTCHKETTLYSANETDTVVIICIKASSLQWICRQYLSHCLDDKNILLKANSKVCYFLRDALYDMKHQRCFLSIAVIQLLYIMYTIMKWNMSTTTYMLTRWFSWDSNGVLGICFTNVFENGFNFGQFCLFLIIYKHRMLLWQWPQHRNLNSLDSIWNTIFHHLDNLI